MILNEAVRQINRLSLLPRWSEIPQSGRQELTEQLMKAFPSERQASGAIDSWLRRNQWPPTVADIWGLASEFVDRPEPPLDRNCAACGGSGFKQGWELNTYLGGLDKNGNPVKTIDVITFDKWNELRRLVDGHKQAAVEAVGPCHCRYGIFLQQARHAEKMRKQEEREAKRGR
jgi:hypothetical protein